MPGLPEFLHDFTSVRIAGVLTRVAMYGMPGFFSNISHLFDLMRLVRSAGGPACWRAPLDGISACRARFFGPRSPSDTSGGG